MPVRSLEELAAQIRAAWADAVRPPDNEICNAAFDEGVSAYFAGRPWHGHDVHSLRWHSVALSLFSPQGFCYYLPAYLLAVIEDSVDTGGIYDSIINQLSPTQLDRPWADTYRARIAGFDEAQKRAIISYLEWFRDRHEESAGSPPEDIAAAIAYLTTGEVPRARSAVERLLQLAGRRGSKPEEISALWLSSPNLADDDLAGLADFHGLRELDLAGTEISDAGLAHLSTPAVFAALAKLEKLDLSNCKQISAAGLIHLNALSGLAELRGPDCPLDDDALASLHKLTLRELELSPSPDLTDRGWATFDVSRLEVLEMRRVPASDALMARLGDAGVLRELSCGGGTEAGVVALASRAKPPALAFLHIDDAAALGEPALAALAGLPALCELELGKLNARSWSSGFPALAKLTLSNGALSAEAARDLAALPSLTRLALYGEQLAPGTLAALARAPSLRRLDLAVADLDDASFSELAGSPVEHLRVRAPKLGNAALAVLSQLPRLQELSLSSLSIDDEGLAHLSEVPALRSLQLQSIPIGNAGLLHLVSCKELVTLRLIGAKVTSTALDAFRRVHPALEVSNL